MSQLALALIREAKEKRLTRLDLGNCGLTELPEELFELVWLEELILCGTGGMFDVENMKWRYFSSQNKGSVNHFRQFSSEIKKLQNLKTLCADTWTEEWEEHDVLDALEGLAQLQSLYILRTGVSELSALKKLSNLRVVYFSGKFLNDLSPLKELTQLQALYVSHTRVRDLSPLKELTQLQALWVSKTQVHDLSPLKNLAQLRLLDASLTQVNDLSPIEKLNRLQFLYVNYTKVNDLTPLRNLTNLNNLDISSTQVSNLRPIEKLINGNMVVRPIYDGFTDNRILITDCPLENPPSEIAEQGNEAILNYWKQIEAQGGAETINEAKLIIVGEGKTGKTTLFNKLINPVYDLHQNPTDETHGINVYEGLALSKLENGKKSTFRANLWDFGGQELQYMTHQFFLTPRALYILLIDARAESPNLAYWFKIISLLGKGSEDEKVQLLLVFNKKKGSTGMPQYQDILKYYASDFDYQFLEIDLAENDKRWECLKEAIENRLFDLPIVKNALPKQWKAIRETLRKEAQKRSYISTERLSEICSLYNVTEEKDQWQMSNYLHQLGSLLHFQNDPDLMDLVVLSPEWAVEGVYLVLKSELIKEEQKGKFSADDIFNILQTKGYSRADSQKILKLMSKNNFDICYPSQNRQFVAAQLLPDDTPLQFQWHTHLGALQFRYQYPIMPKGLISRLIVRLSDDIEIMEGTEIVWKKGAILRMKVDGSECRILMKEDNAESKSGLRQIIIEVMGEDYRSRKYALRRVRDEVDALHKRWFRNIKTDEMIPCCCNECLKSSTPQLYKLENLLKKRTRRPDTSCDDSGEDVSIDRLLEGIYEQVEINDFQEGREKSVEL